LINEISLIEKRHFRERMLGSGFVSNQLGPDVAKKQKEKIQ